MNVLVSRALFYSPSSHCIVEQIPSPLLVEQSSSVSLVLTTNECNNISITTGAAPAPYDFVAFSISYCVILLEAHMSNLARLTRSKDRGQRIYSTRGHTRRIATHPRSSYSASIHHTCNDREVHRLGRNLLPTVHFARVWALL
jgi:hypothetical protein